MLTGLFLGSCQETGSVSEIPAALPNPAAASPATSISAAASPALPDTTSIEFIDSDEVTINGTQHLVGRTASLYKVLGRPDSLVAPNMLDYCMPYYDNRSFKCAYYGRSCVEVYGDTAVVSSLNFKRHPGLELHSEGLRLSRTTTLASLGKVFPQAVKKQSVLDVYKTGKRVAVVLQSAQIPNDYSWLLLFHNGLLESIELSTPC
ncbi:hypothetical protein GCM10011378_38890 [Hymenobacter glacieicola]|uniref:Beta-lactamase-inhibitor-like PepSY-like domain-containing protein n=1 Tax=Hymenobacter glacieicola TaxID=1562124 RepID=A0ABQ1X459_9BACT|nr:hypothetical protein GCM10011378_38890 [Hymenobacter glacieicola]